MTTQRSTAAAIIIAVLIAIANMLGGLASVDEVQPEHADLCTEDEILAYAPERPDAPICVHIEGDGARFFPSEVNVGK